MRYDEYLAAGYPIGSGVIEGADLDLAFVHPAPVSDAYGLPSDDARCTEPGTRLGLLCFDRLQIQAIGVGHDCTGKRMIALPFDRGGELEQFVLVDFIQAGDTRDAHSSKRQRARLVEDDLVDRAGRLQRACALDQQSPLRANTRSPLS